MEQENIKKLKEEFPFLFEVFSPKLLQFALSEEMARKIANICIEHKITDQEKVVGIAFRVTYALLGKLPRESLAFTIKEGLQVDEETAEKIAKRIDEIIFSEVKKITEKKEEEKKESEVTEKEQKDTRKTPPSSLEKDSYREPIE